MELKLAVAGFMSKAVGNSVTYNPSQIVLTAGATPAIEILSFCLADSGNAFIVLAPYYPSNLGKMKTPIKFIAALMCISLHRLLESLKVNWQSPSWKVMGDLHFKSLQLQHLKSNAEDRREQRVWSSKVEASVYTRDP